MFATLRRSPRFATRAPSPPPLRRSPRLAARTNQSSKEFFRCRRSLRLQYKFTKRYAQLQAKYTPAYAHPNHRIMSALPEVKAIVSYFNMMIDVLTSTEDYIIKAKIVMELYERLLSDRGAYCLLAASPSFRSTSYMKISEFCDYLPYNTMMSTLRDRLVHLIRGPLKKHPLYVPDII